MIHLQNLANEGSLSEYLENETNFLHSMLSDDRMTEQKIAHAIMDFYTGGVPAVGPNKNIEISILNSICTRFAL